MWEAVRMLVGCAAGLEEQPVGIGLGVYVRRAGGRLVLSTAAAGAIYLDRVTLARLVKLAEVWEVEDKMARINDDGAIGGG